MNQFTIHTYTSNNPGIVLICFVIGTVLYFLPTIIAFRRKHKSRLAILLLNFLLGGTGIVWIITLIWALA